MSTLDIACAGCHRPLSWRDIGGQDPRRLDPPPAPPFALHGQDGNDLWWYYRCDCEYEQDGTGAPPRPLRDAYDRGRADERAAVVAWLTDAAECAHASIENADTAEDMIRSEEAWGTCDFAAAEIRDGKHHQTAQENER